MEAGASSVCLTVSPLPPLASPLIFNRQQLRLSATGPTVCPDKNDNKEGGEWVKKKANRQTKGEKKVAARVDLDPKTQTGTIVVTPTAL